ncbi:MAG: type II toxin-antitoxin system RelE/ParE family toxin [Planctomycetales bacterium]|nr:type II toxin-antitoxin system RelE/ParE family toxin [Planctomycetales bacterium]
MSRRVVVRIQPEAEDAILENALWWMQNRSAQQGERWFDAIYDAIRGFRDRPQKWPLAPEASVLGMPIRELHFGIGTRPTHRILFVCRDDDVVVVAIRHVSQKDLGEDDVSPV